MDKTRVYKRLLIICTSKHFITFLLIFQRRIICFSLLLQKKSFSCLSEAQLSWLILFRSSQIQSFRVSTTSLAATCQHRLPDIPLLWILEHLVVISMPLAHDGVPDPPLHSSNTPSIYSNFRSGFKQRLYCPWFKCVKIKAISLFNN